MPYSSSLTDAEWRILEPLLPQILPAKKRTRPANWSVREILNGILYQLKNGCNWQDLPMVSELVEEETYPLTQLSTGITSSGEPQEYLRN
jgi:hypothetical protein